MNRLKAFIRSERFRELFVYCVVGGLTTVVNYIVYFAITRIGAAAVGVPKDHLLLIEIANIAAWIFAVAFAFWANKRYVFKSMDWSRDVLLHEIPGFVAARLLSLAFDAGFLALAVKLLGMNDMTAKLLSSIIVIIINYFASKFWIFRKKNT